MVIVALRLPGAALTVAMGWIHLDLWQTGYRDIPVIGMLFLLNVIGSGVLALALLVVSRRVVGPVAALGTVFAAGTLAALVVSLTVGLFGFREVAGGPWVTATVIVETAATVVLAALAMLTRPHPRQRSRWSRHGYRTRRQPERPSR
ncbi:hypothetical protein [Gandjariella thermophila]|uniref:hypothetical protein n=1 Tax=Gandjariella thermophila TaxID=1931992 RepID=UPI0010F6E848|nr:hypothetical protein [Gandjariella thermophila]